ncbi:hypothetical protein [Asticcacaulis machinosus]|uniref:DUF2171 domain-containing protein n=1 Tax=Asticcacaulis machinosus TaxID=2984211 RepID=A0ABT5HHD3_9CAUL|nr:hypothetical protein [Asticcacaulis machinosus]MDC7675565.1 hypothetical protein [Asticcacaulis machinosus]
MSVLKDGDRIEHADKGLGTVTSNPGSDDVVVISKHDEAETFDVADVYVIWDDDRFPVYKVPVSELTPVPDAAAATTMGI